MCQASRRPHTATSPATSQRRHPVPSSSAAPTIAAVRATSTKPAPQATSTTAALSSWRARTAAAPIPTATASRPARRTTRTGTTSAQLRDGQPRTLDGLRRVPGPSGGLDHSQDDRLAHARDDAAPPLGAAVLGGEGVEEAHTLFA